MQFFCEGEQKTRTLFECPKDNNLQFVSRHQVSNENPYEGNQAKWRN